MANLLADLKDYTMDSRKAVWMVARKDKPKVVMMAEMTADNLVEMMVGLKVEKKVA